jgi:multiple sugar transport system permease protein
MSVDGPPATTPVLRAPQQRGRLSFGQKQYLLFVLLVLPAVGLRLLTAAYPIVQTVYRSFTNLDLIVGTGEFIGSANYAALVNDPVVRTSVNFTVIFVVVSTALQLGLGLAIAMFLNAQFRGRMIVRGINLLPWAIPTIVAAYAFRWMLDDQFGIITQQFLAPLGYEGAPLVTRYGARMSLILVNVWKNTPFVAAILLAGLQALPHDVYEAARVDGATAWQRFRHITIPLLIPTLLTTGLFFLIWQLGSFDLVYGLTDGGPGSATELLSLTVFRAGLLFFTFGYGSAIAVVLLILVALMSIIGVMLFRRYQVSA